MQYCLPLQMATMVVSLLPREAHQHGRSRASPRTLAWIETPSQRRGPRHDPAVRRACWLLLHLLPPLLGVPGRDAFVRIGEDVTETVERRPASLVVVRTHKPKFVPKGRDRAAECQVLQAATPELPIGSAADMTRMSHKSMRHREGLEFVNKTNTLQRRGILLGAALIAG